jgi:hypothetical protein
MFAVLSAWILLGEAMTISQAVGGTVVLLGLALARQGDRSEQANPEFVGQVELATWPDMPLREPTERAND